ncbi:cellulose synthase subunit BcsC-related outer membrane protein [Salinicola lusitanus]|uniref:Cellulose synthase subunit BcsC-related outer membrane protein n=1 Tax=Salinicola lusitanus TaxID=1949085 RepID=A0ABZ3CMK8_9GAMM
MKRDLWRKAILLCALGGSASVLAQSSDATLQPLFEQADFWQSHQRNDLAEESLNRVLTADPGNPEALYRLGMMAVANQDTEAVTRWLSQLSQAAPDDPRVERLRQAQARSDIDNAELARARALARAGNTEQAVRAYQSLISPTDPPWDLAPEYYETLAGTPEGWEQARAGLERLNQRDPGDHAVSLALARVLTYRAETREDGIARLAAMSQSTDVKAAWRQALLWLDASADDQGVYERYLQRYPDDQAVREYYLAKTAAPETDTLGAARQAGYTALDKQNLDEAQRQFQRVLDETPNDAEALAGLGLVQLRRQRFAEARDELGRAISLSPQSASRWQGAFRSASFYAELAEVRRLADQGHLDQALSKVAPLGRTSGQDGRSAQLLEAELLRRDGQLEAAEQGYRRLMERSPSDVAAASGLVNVLRDQKRWDEAAQVAEKLPARVRDGLGDPRHDQAMALRQQANQSLLAGNSTQAQQQLIQAVNLAPEDPWIRLDLARLYQSQGKPYQASFVMSPLLGTAASPDALKAAALLASEQQHWDEAAEFLDRLPTEGRDADTVALAQRVTFNRRLASLRQRLDSHDPAARQALLDWYRQPPQTPADLGGLALLMADNGEQGMALQLVRSRLADADIDESPTDYLNYALVLAKSGRIREANDLLRRLDEAASSSEDRLAVQSTARGLAVVEADRLRQQQQYAAAYDVLLPQLQAAPDDTSLLLALGRLYSSGDMPEAAGTVYDHLLERNPDNDDVLAGAVNAALEQGEGDRAEQLLVDHAPIRSPELVVLAARTARMKGDHRQAVQLLEQARAQRLQQDGDQWLLPGTRVASSQLLLPGNPFRRTRDAARVTVANAGAMASRGAWLPGAPDSSQASAGVDSIADDPVLVEIDRLLAELHDETATYLKPEATLRSRDGEEGLSELTSLGSSVTFSAAPFKRGRLEVSLSPEYISAGTPGSNARGRYGSNVFVDAAENLSDSLDGVGTVLDSIQQSADSYAALQIQAQENPDDPLIERQLARAAENFDDALSRNPFFESGIETASLSTEQLAKFRTAVTDFVVTDDLSTADQAQLRRDIDVLFDADFQNVDADGFDDIRQTLEESIANVQQGIARRLSSVPSAARSPDSIHDAGVGLRLAYRWDSADIDIGATPQGFEKSNVVGGVAWRPKLTDNTTLELKIERRAVTDSVLSYAGVKDPLTGETWGGVTRTGGAIGIAYDDGDSGAYASAGAYAYEGEHVADNHSVEVTTGAYVRPINEPDRQLQIGVNLGYMGYDKNLRYFTYGHGGYFSPQDYVSLSLPISYRQRQDKWTYHASIAPGFQSYSEDDADYFPEDGDAQDLLDTLAGAGLVGQSRYQGESKSGFGITLKGGVAYEVAPNLSVGGAVGYDTFGDYSESTGQLYLDYRLGAGP